MRLGERLKELRQKANMSQPLMAEASGLPLGSIRQYEQGRRDPLWQVLFKLADALGVSVEVFRDCVEEAPPSKPAAEGKTAKPSKHKRKT